MTQSIGLFGDDNNAFAHPALSGRHIKVVMLVPDFVVVEDEGFDVELAFYWWHKNFGNYSNDTTVTYRGQNQIPERWKEIDEKVVALVRSFRQPPEQKQEQTP